MAGCHHQYCRICTSWLRAIGGKGKIWVGSHTVWPGSYHSFGILASEVQKDGERGISISTISRSNKLCNFIVIAMSTHQATFVLIGAHNLCTSGNQSSLPTMVNPQALNQYVTILQVEVKELTAEVKELKA